MEETLSTAVQELSRRISVIEQQVLTLREAVPVENADENKSEVVQKPEDAVKPSDVQSLEVVQKPRDARESNDAISPGGGRRRRSRRGKRLRKSRRSRRR